MVAIRAGAREVPVLKPADVRFGSKADVTLSNFDVRFTPESGHWFLWFLSHANVSCLSYILGPASGMVIALEEICA